ncbi:hypothetical protein NQ317_010974 [Molorchus minor]|uniref:Uncharacterized protein n=1 Tax=Molorchus minor TaxID=1323400 RepID=A0ABQ9J3Y6_9CUCU|nr:hypothetical protein NQ317_010974 [Molorchus minor]
MPYNTKELYQKFPRPRQIADKIPSICVASYPLVFRSVVGRMMLLKRKSILCKKLQRVYVRARSDYNLPNKTKTEGRVLIPQQQDTQPPPQQVPTAQAEPNPFQKYGVSITYHKRIMITVNRM